MFLVLRGFPEAEIPCWLKGASGNTAVDQASLTVRGADSAQVSSGIAQMLLYLLIAAVLPPAHVLGRESQQQGSEGSCGAGVHGLHPHGASRLYFYQFLFPCQSAPETGLFSSFLFCSAL